MQENSSYKQSQQTADKQMVDIATVIESNMYKIT